jgi:CPA1 family monovalent cation:H+ antiporter
MSPFALAAILMTLVALSGWVNSRTLRLPHGVAMLIAGLATAVLLWLLQSLVPGFMLARRLSAIVNSIDFASTVTGYMLAFLLFAGAMQVDLAEMRRRMVSVSLLATFGVAASIAVVGIGLWLIAKPLGLPLPLSWSLVFGALISPTDPVAVLATVRLTPLPGPIVAILQGEALFNDGVGIVAFFALLALATGTGSVSPVHVFLEVWIEGLGGLALGVAAAALAIMAMDRIDEFGVEVSISIAVAMLVYTTAQALGLSGAIAVVGAGMMFGTQRAKKAVAGETEQYLRSFWVLVDEILNALLFLLLGVEMFVVPFQPGQLVLIVAAIALVLIARFAVVIPWGALYGATRRGERGAIGILGWGGLHGALSLALALSLPAVPERSLILAITSAVVAFSIIVQGLSFAPLAVWLQKSPRAKRESAGT